MESMAMVRIRSWRGRVRRMGKGRKEAVVNLLGVALLDPGEELRPGTEVLVGDKERQMLGFVRTSRRMPNSARGHKVEVVPVPDIDDDLSYSLFWSYSLF
jgi:hypothetical protein